MANPLLLADFLTSSYETQNNASKILSLHGLYILMTQSNLEYPFFFGKLYSLLTIDLFDAKYKARFFYLLDIFLQSSYVKTYFNAKYIFLKIFNLDIYQQI
jgi:U3 small nucleolar RNA-associated protein 19